MNTKNIHRYKKTQQNSSEKSQTLRHPSQNDFDQTLFLKLIVLESTEEMSITKLSPEKTLGSMIKPKFVKKLAKNTLLVEVTKKLIQTFY